MTRNFEDQICIISESTVSNVRCQLKLSDAFVGQNFKYQAHVIDESAAKLLRPITTSVKHALSAEVR